MNKMTINRIKKQLVLWVITALLIALFGFWYGESNKAGFGGILLAMLVSLPILAMLMFAHQAIIKQTWFMHLFMALAFFVINAAAYSYGASAAHNAFNDCINNGEQVRIALQNFYNKNKRK